MESSEGNVCGVDTSQDSLEICGSSGFEVPESVDSPELFDMISELAGLMSELVDIADTSIPTIDELLKSLFSPH